MTESLNRSALRAECRSRRRALSDSSRGTAESNICAATLELLAHFTRSGHIATYLLNDGEVDLAATHFALRQQSISLALPVVDPDTAGAMAFHHWPQDSELITNRYGILEPAVSRALTPEQIDAVLVPLVAFTADGHRLGMGGGYYDRWIESARRHQERVSDPSPGPAFIGIAFQTQRVPRLPTEAWDQRLDYIVTEHKVYGNRSSD